MAIDREQDFVNGVTVVTAEFLNLFQEVMAGYLSPNFKLEALSTTQLQVPAGAGDDSVAIVIDGEMRRRESAVSVTISGGAATYDIYATADSADDLFALEFTASGGAPAATKARKIGEVDWSGTAITRFRHEHYLPHGSLHDIVGPDPIQAYVNTDVGLGVGTNGTLTTTFEPLASFTETLPVLIWKSGTTIECSAVGGFGFINDGQGGSLQIRLRDQLTGAVGLIRTIPLATTSYVLDVAAVPLTVTKTAGDSMAFVVEGRVTAGGGRSWYAPYVYGRALSLRTGETVA